MAIKKNNKLLDVLVNNLAEQGYDAIKKAYDTRDFINRTYHLHDSYGSAVYVNGVLQEKTIRYVGSVLRPPKDYGGELISGREELLKFFHSEYDAPKEGIQLVIVAAIFYAGILENGGGGIKRKYKVISGGIDIMENLATQYKGSSLYRIDYLMNKTRLV